MIEKIAWTITCVTLLAGGILGAQGWRDPKWAADLVRLAPKPEAPEAVAEFRASFGGLFFALHAAALGFFIWGSPETAMAASVILACGWWCTALARYQSYRQVAAAKHEFVLLSIQIEVVAGLLILAWPIYQWSGLR